MRPTFFGLQIGKAGLTTSQFGLDVTSHNIANVETDGFTRQRVVQTAIVPATGFGRAMPPISQLRVGVGTRVLEHNQVRSEFLDRRFRTENSAAAYWTTRSQEMRYLESFFDSVNEETSINTTIANFFDAVRILTGDTVENAPRTLLRDAGLDMVQQFNMIFNGLVAIQETQNRVIETKIGDINIIAREIADLNRSIYLHEITGHIALDLRDRRNLLVDELSTLIDVEYRTLPHEDGFERFELSIGGRVLVHHDEHALLGVIERPSGVPGMPDVLQPVWVQELGGLMMGIVPPEGADLSEFTQIRVMGEPDRWIPNAHLPNLRDQDLNLDSVVGGQIKALVNMRDGTGTGNTPKGVPYYIEMMNNLARSLVQEINSVHRQGWSDHPVDGSNTGINFFHVGRFENAEGQRIILNNDNRWVLIEADGRQSNPPVFFDDIAFDAWDTATPDTFPDGFTFNASIDTVTAQNIRLSAEIRASAFNIAVSGREIIRGDIEEGQPEYLQQGNNENMLDMHRLFTLGRNFTVTLNANNPLVESRTITIGSFDGFATSIRHDVGSTTELAVSAANNGRTLITAMFNQRESVAGVSLDEEMVALIRYQHAYSGAARVITAMDDALDRLINGTGRVGL